MSLGVSESVDRKKGLKVDRVILTSNFKKAVGLDKMRALVLENGSERNGSKIIK